MRGTPFWRIQAADGAKRGPAAGKRNVGSCNSKIEAARPLSDEIGPLSDLKGAQHLAKRTRLQADPRKYVARPLFEGLQPLGGQKGVQQHHSDQKRPCQTPFCKISAAERSTRGPGSFTQKQQWRRKNLHQSSFSKQWKTPWTPLRNTMQIPK